MGDVVRVICGPTAAGKSAVALWLAERHEATIISADSRQVYRGFDVGTAKPSIDERARVPHRGVDVADPTQRCSAAAWADAADAWIEEARSGGRAPLVVGGTGFYLRALFGELFVEPYLDPERRRALEGLLALMPVPELRRWTTRLDPSRAQLGRTQLLRSVEIALLTGERLSELHRTRGRPPRHRARYLLVDPGAALGARLERRLDAMLATGWPDEVRRLVQLVPEHAPAWNATGYATIRRLVRGELTEREARDTILIDTRQYAKRQRTWFRHQLPPGDVMRLDPAADDWRERAEAWWHSDGEGAS